MSQPPYPQESLQMCANKLTKPITSTRHFMSQDRCLTKDSAASVNTRRLYRADVVRRVLYCSTGMVARLCFQSAMIKVSRFVMSAGVSKTLLLSALFAAPVTALGDIVWLKNGDRMTGTIKFSNGGKVLLSTDYGGTVSVDIKDVKTLQTSHRVLVKQKDSNGERIGSLQPSSDGTVMLDNADGPKPVALANIDEIIKPKPLMQDLVLSGSADLAMDFKRADTDTDDYNVAVKYQARHGEWRHSTTGEFHRESQDGEITTDNWEAEYSVDKFINDHWFVQGRLEYKNDKIESFERQRTVGVGPGYQFWDNELGAFSLVSLLNRTDYQYSDGDMEHFYSAAIKWDYNRYIAGKTVQIFTTGELARPFDNTAVYSLDTAAGLRYKVTEWASLNLKAEKDDISGTSKSDLHTTRYTAGLGIMW